MAEIQVFDISAAVERNRRAKEETMLFDIVNNRKPKAKVVKRVEKEDHSACYMAAILAVPFIILLLVTLTLFAIR